MGPRDSGSMQFDMLSARFMLGKLRSSVAESGFIMLIMIRVKFSAKIIEGLVLAHREGMRRKSLKRDLISHPANRHAGQDQRTSIERSSVRLFNTYDTSLELQTPFGGEIPTVPAHDGKHTPILSKPVRSSGLFLTSLITTLYLLYKISQFTRDSQHSFRMGLSWVTAKLFTCFFGTGRIPEERLRRQIVVRSMAEMALMERIGTLQSPMDFGTKSYA
ncbi:hypothetical protein CCUS01_00184 [Colletotrichum cuscutae]|uniref:Uncharacterized protein n=1 Tax=Colletotrichum cuscutae TaxID=1209917 RepID=A0AAI9YDW5_9PEZI|nr:hypothetical protein CCUS01_00184 [Colletotrichum cuscutae]